MHATRQDVGALYVNKACGSMSVEKREEVRSRAVIVKRGLTLTSPSGVLIDK